MKEKLNFSQIDKDQLIDIIINATNEAIVVVDHDGIIEILSDAYAEFLNVDKEKAVGKHVTDVIENTRMHVVLKTKIPEIAAVQEINGQKMIATRVPIFKNGNLIGAFGRVMFKNVNEVAGLYSEINKIEQELSLYKNKFGSMTTAKYSVDDLIGTSQPMVRLRKTILQVSKGNSNILILGESGTGKELFAHAIHAASMRSAEPLICVNCASIPSELMESEFFGYEEGAFTGARKGGKMGLFQAANKGTLFLDEIGDLPMPMQVKLLRVLQDKEVRRVGANVGEKIDVRIIAATNRNLTELMENEKFRPDLYYRLNVVGINIPPLRERIEDMRPLVKSLLEKISEKNGILIQGITDEALEGLKKCDWPGNIRELENVLERAVNFLGPSRKIEKAQLGMSLNMNYREFQTGTLKEILEDTERNAILCAIENNRGRKTLAAKELGISRTTLYEKLSKINLAK